MPSRKLIAATALAGIATAVAALLSITFGARIVTLSEVITGLSHIASLDALNNTSDLGAVAVHQRLPRTALALTLGAALGVSGTLMQAITRNPIADPGILGINAGAALAVATGITVAHVHSQYGIFLCALGGGLLTAFVVYSIGSIGPGGSTPIKLALAGVATSAVLSSLTTALRLPASDNSDEFRFWLVGTVAGSNWSAFIPLLPFLAGAFLVAFLCARPLNSLALGDHTAISLGVNVQFTRVSATCAAVVLAAAATALAGPIGFVGLMVPHILRQLIGVDMRALLPLSAVAGAVVLTLADVLGRVIARPTEISVGIITAFVGAPILVAIVRSTRVRDV